MRQTRRWLIAESALGLAVGLAVTGVWFNNRPQYFWPRWVWFALGLALTVGYSLRWALGRPRGRQRAFAIHAVLTGDYIVMDLTIWVLAGGGFFWPGFSVPIVTAALVAHAWRMQHVPPAREQELVNRVDRLARSRSGALDVQAAELRRIERDLHDGAQARLVSLAMNLGLASELLHRNPDGVAALLVEARSTTLSALEELRTVMEGIQPPVLADRGLVGAVEAIALGLPLPVTVTAAVPGRLDPPVESAVYFTVTECLANIVKHSRATAASVDLRYDLGRLVVRVTDNGVGGASLRSGSGLSGLTRRLDVFDGQLTVTSPPGGPTDVAVEVPCALLSPRTSSSSATA
jgi:signal transduction histidine kinase